MAYYAFHPKFHASVLHCHGQSYLCNDVNRYDIVQITWHNGTVNVMLTCLVHNLGLVNVAAKSISLTSPIISWQNHNMNIWKMWSSLVCSLIFHGESLRSVKVNKSMATIFTSINSSCLRTPRCSICYLMPYILPYPKAFHSSPHLWAISR